MLANPHWDAPSMSSFESWLETQDPSQKYPYSDCERCACAQYLRHIGKYEDRWLARSERGSTILKLNELAAGNLYDSDDPGHTFGQLLGRVRERRLVAQLAVV